MKSHLAYAVKTLFPGYFSMAMATGALSIALHLLGISTAARALLWVNITIYFVLWTLTLARLWRFPGRVLADLVDHARGPGFFTLVAATCVFGTQSLLVGENAAAAHALWFVGVGLWVVVMYAFFTAVTISSHKPSLENGINGAWLIAAVATQSIAVLGSLLFGGVPTDRPLLFLSLCMYLLGCMLYLSIITLIFYRLTFIRLTTEAMAPPYWINMGAVAITTLAGANLILHAAGTPFLQSVLPFLKGFTLFFWTASTWWIPLLLALTIWRHLIRRHSLRYDPQFWGMAFPLAVYTTGTFQLARALDLPFLTTIPRVFVYVAAAVWATTFTGMAMHLYRRARLPVTDS